MNSRAQDIDLNLCCTGDRANYGKGLVPLILVVLLEAALFFPLLLIALPPGVGRMAGLSALILSLVIATYAMTAPLFSGHHLSLLNLHIRYGFGPFGFRAKIEVSEIAEAEPISQKIDAIQTLGANYVANKKRLVAAFSSHGLVLVKLKEPRLFRLGYFRSGLVCEILLNIDVREKFLTTLNTCMRQAPQNQRANEEKRQLLGSSREPHPNSETTGEMLTETRETAITKIPTWPLAGERELPLVNPAIRINELSRNFGNISAVSNLTLNISKGELYGFLGTNGAGKTTTIRMMVGLLKPSCGAITLGDHDVWKNPLEIRRIVGYVPDTPLLYDRLTGREYLEFLAQLREIDRFKSEQRIEQLLELLDFERSANILCRTYSFGTKRKLAVAGALIHEPEILILDEPLNGLDPRSARRLKDLFREWALKGKTIFISTHDLASAEQICTRVGIIHSGKLVCEGPAERIRAMVGTSSLENAFIALTSEDSRARP